MLFRESWPKGNYMWSALALSSLSYDDNTKKNKRYLSNVSTRIQIEHPSCHTGFEIILSKTPKA